MSKRPKTPPMHLKINERSLRRPSKPASMTPHETRRCILVDCESETAQRELFEHLQQRGATCRLLTL